MRRYFAIAAIAAVSLGVIGVSQANASTHINRQSTSVNVFTRSFAHEDTTSVTGTATFPSDRGPVWAFDNLNENWKITQNADVSPGTHDFTVVLNVYPKGSHFSEFADPRSSSEGSSNPGGPMIGHGGISGTISYDIQTANEPSLNSVPDIQPPNTSLGAVLDELFTSGQYNIVGPTPYTFTYTNVAGAPYVQTG